MDENKNKEDINDIFIKHGHLLKRLRLGEIIWIRSEGNYCTINTIQKRHVMKISLVRILEGLPDAEFVQIHRSYVVRIDQITYIDIQANQVSIGDEMLPVGRTFKDNLLDRINLL